MNTILVPTEQHELMPSILQTAVLLARKFDSYIDGFATIRAVLFEAGRPLLIAPPSPPQRMGENILIAWNCSTEQSTTTALAMPLLQRASRVVVLTVPGGTVPGPTGEQLARYLERN